MRQATHYIPIVTTVVALLFAAQLRRRWTGRAGATYLLWWLVGALTYAAGTLTESLTTLFGWHAGVFRAWYITGALLGGAPLAQGTVYLLMTRRTAHRLSAALISVVVIASCCVMLSPLDLSLVEPGRLSGRVLEWHWVRAFSPFINLYALVFLVGGAAVSAWRYVRRRGSRARVWGNVAIAVGALLPGIGGSFTRFGYVEVLYVTELIGLASIWAGYAMIAGDRGETIHAAQAAASHAA